MEAFEEKYRLYYESNSPTVDWVRAAQSVAAGEPIDEFFTLPWWQTELRSVYLYGSNYNKARIAGLRSLPIGGSRARKKWHVGVLYPGVPDE